MEVWMVEISSNDRFKSTHSCRMNCNVVIPFDERFKHGVRKQKISRMMMNQGCCDGKQWNVCQEVRKNNVMDQKWVRVEERNRFSENERSCQNDKVVDPMGQIWDEIGSCHRQEYDVQSMLRTMALPLDLRPLL